MLIVDAHLDLGQNALLWNRDLTRTVAETRESERTAPERAWAPGMKPWPEPGRGRGAGTVALPEMRRGRVALASVVLWAKTGPAPPTYSCQQIAYAAAQGQLAYFRILASSGHCRIIMTKHDLSEHIREWRDWDSAHPTSEGADDFELPPPVGFIISMESADPVIHPEQLADWWHGGLRILGPAHGGVNVYAHGQGLDGGLRAGAGELLARMRQAGMIMDLAHLSDRSLQEVMDLWDGPVMVSHGSCRALVPGGRPSTDDHIRTLASRNGVFGVIMSSEALNSEFRRSKSGRETVGLDRAIDHMDHICQITGSAQHVALGTDLDGWFGLENTPHEVDTVADLQKIAVLLERRGYRSEDIAGIMHGNWLRFFGENLPETNEGTDCQREGRTEDGRS